MGVKKMQTVGLSPKRPAILARAPHGRWPAGEDQCKQKKNTKISWRPRQEQSSGNRLASQGRLDSIVPRWGLSQGRVPDLKSANRESPDGKMYHTRERLWPGSAQEFLGGRVSYGLDGSFPSRHEAASFALGRVIASEHRADQSRGRLRLCFGNLRQPCNCTPARSFRHSRRKHFRIFDRRLFVTHHTAKKLGEQSGE